MMKKKHWVASILALLMLQFCLALPLTAAAADYEAVDVSLTPGSNASELNFAWITDEAGTGECAVQIVNKHPEFKHLGKNKWFSHANKDKKFKKPALYTGVLTQADDGVADYYYCKVNVSDLKNQTEYAYRLGDNSGAWSDPYEYSTENRNKYGFIYLADAQIGAGRGTDEDGDGVADDDIAGWTDTVGIIYEQFPKAAFILSAGDQIETPGSEEQWTGFFSPLQTDSPLPVAPTAANHDQSMRGSNSEAFIYHFNLPNESERFTLSVDEETTMELAGDYYFSYGDVLFMVLNMDSTDYEQHRAFMAEAVAAHPGAKWKVAMWHYTIYTAATRNAFVDRTEMASIMEDLGIDVVLMGHDHTYCRTYPMYLDEVQAETFNRQGESVDPMGVVYFTANSASGSKYYSLASEEQLSSETYAYVAAYAQPNAPMLSYVEVDANSFKITTYRTDTMDVVDSYAIKKTSEKDGKKLKH